MDVLLAVQKGIVAALRGTTAFADVATVWDAVPQNQGAPYVALQYLTKTPWPVGGQGASRGGWEVTATMHVWTGTPGAADALEIVGIVDDVLDDQPLTLPGGYRVVRCWNENTDTSARDPDGQSRGVPVRYRLWVQLAG